MADDNFTDGPGGRLKKEEKKNTLYVSNPNDPRLQAYQDSLSLSKSNFYIPYGERVFKDSEDFKKSFAEKIKRLGLYRDGKYVDVSKYSKGIQPVDYADYDRNRSLSKNNEYTTVIYKKPERPVVLVKRPQSKPIEPIAPRQVSVPTFAPEEIVAPVARPVPVPIAPSAPPFVPAEMAALTREDLVERPVVQRKPPKFILPTQYGGWGREPLLRRLFPRLYMKRTY